MIVVRQVIGRYLNFVRDISRISRFSFRPIFCWTASEALPLPPFVSQPIIPNTQRLFGTAADTEWNSLSTLLVGASY
jgi:hypothetical protein